MSASKSPRSRQICTSRDRPCKSTLPAMTAPTDDDALLDMIQSVALDVLARIGGDPDARYEFLKGFVALAKETVQRAEESRRASPH